MPTFFIIMLWARFLLCVIRLISNNGSLELKSYCDRRFIFSFFLELTLSKYTIISMEKNRLQGIAILLLLVVVSEQAGLNVDLNQPILLRSDAVNITTGAYIKDSPSTSHFYVAFENGQIRAYVEDYSSFLGLNSNARLSKIKGFNTKCSLTLSDSSIIDIDTYLVSTLS